MFTSGLRRPEAWSFHKVIEGIDTNTDDLNINYKSDIAQNMRFDNELGSGVKRPSLAYYNGSVEASAPSNIYHYYNQSGSQSYILSLVGNTVRSSTNGTFATIWTWSGSTGKRFTAVTYKGLAILSTGYDNIIQTDGATAWELGACKAALATGGTGEMTAGVHYYAIAYTTSGADVINGAISNSVTNTADADRVTLSYIPQGPVATTARVIYRTAAGGSTLLKLHTLSDNSTLTWTDTAKDSGTISSAATADAGASVEFTCSAAHGLQVGDWVTISGTTDYNGEEQVTSVSSTVKFKITDTYVSDQSGTWAGGAALGAVTDDMPRGKYLYLDQERLFVACDTATGRGSWIYYSAQERPAWLHTGTADIATTQPADSYEVFRFDDGDVVTGMASILGKVYVFKQKTIIPWEVRGVPETWTVGSPQSIEGCPAPYSIVMTPFGIIYLGWNRFFLFDGQFSSPIIADINVSETFLDTCRFETVGYYWNSLYLCAYTDANDGKTYHDRVLVYDTINKQASTDKGGPLTSGFANIGSFTSFKGNTEWGQLYAGDSNLGWVYQYSRQLITSLVSDKASADLGTYTKTQTLGENNPVVRKFMLDDMESYLTDTLAQAAWVTDETDLVPIWDEMGTGADGAYAPVANETLGENAVTYTAKTATTFTGCSGARAHANRIRVKGSTDAILTYLNGAVAVGDTTITVDSTTGFSVTGTIYISEATGSKNYTSINIPAGVTVTCATYTGSGGFIDLRCTGDVVIAGTLTTTGKGYRGGISASGAWVSGQQGESYTGTQLGPAGPGTSAHEVPNYGGGASGYYAWPENWPPAGGAGGGYGTAGAIGNYPSFGNTITCPGGLVYGDVKVTDFYMGSGGGSGGAGIPGTSGKGGAGGGKIQIIAPKITISTGGIVSSNGAAGGNGSSTNGGGGGGGSGGSIWLKANTITLVGTGVITATGGAAGTGSGSGYSGHGGAGGVGRIRLDYVTLTGTTTPTVGYIDSSEFVPAIQSYTNAVDYNEGLRSLTVKASGGALSLNGTITKTISSTDLSAAADDVILVDVKSNRAGTNLQFGIGETAGTDNLVNVPIAVADTWETVALSYVAVADADKNAIIKLAIKFTNTDTYNELYIDNIRTGRYNGTSYLSPMFDISAGSMDKIYWNENLAVVGPTTYGEILVYTRSSNTATTYTSFTDDTGWSAALTDPSGSVIASTAYRYFQYKVVFSSTDTTGVYFPYIYKADGFMIKFTYYKVATTAETAVEFRYRNGWRNFDTVDDKIFKKICSVHEGTTGAFNLIVEADKQDTQTYIFSGIDLTTNPKRFISNLPSTMYGKELRIEWYKNDNNDFKIQQYGLFVETMPMI